MKYSFAAVALLAASVSAQSACNSVAAQIPSCASACLAPAITSAGCGLTDFKCQCASTASAAIQGAAQGCVLSACGANAISVINSAAAVCSCAATAAAAAPVSTTPPSAPASTSVAVVSPSSSSAADGGVAPSPNPQSSSTPSSSSAVKTASTSKTLPIVPLATGGVVANSTSISPPIATGAAPFNAVAVIGTVFAAFGVALALL